ncbi:MAG: AfsR/SARP family transcriptional regulator [Actinomycetota bacterium]|nr:AfsR/SARP family transcriptional regulator [Actinomycetota bacterium]
MRVNTLGPLQITGETTLTVNAAKQRAVLAVLLVCAGRVVPVPRIVDELWEQAPPTAVGLVRQYVFHLRRALAPARAGGLEIRTCFGGYQLTLPAEAGDADEFRRLALQAHREFAAGRPADARHTTERALGLWRGPAFADVPAGRLVTAERERLDEIRLGLEELGARSDLLTGDAAAAVGRLKALVAENPLREHLHEALVHALLAAGRRADALAAYRCARSTIARELGLAPGKGLRRLERAIREDEEIAYDPPAA